MVCAVARNPLQALARHPQGYRWLMKRSRLVAVSERTMRRVTGDRLGVLDLVGIPSAQVIAVGRRTGRARTTTLQLIVDDEEFIVVGSNWAARTSLPGCTTSRRRRSSTSDAEAAGSRPPSGSSRATSGTGPGRRSSPPGPTTPSPSRWPGHGPSVSSPCARCSTHAGAVPLHPGRPGGADELSRAPRRRRASPGPSRTACRVPPARPHPWPHPHRRSSGPRSARGRLAASRR